MMSKDQAEIVKIVYQRFMESEEDGAWTDLDSTLEYFSWMSDKDIIREAEIKIFEYNKGVLRCKQDHPQDLCMAPLVLESAIAITQLFKKSKTLDGRNKYILEYFLTMGEMGLIYAV